MSMQRKGRVLIPSPCRGRGSASIIALYMYLLGGAGGGEGEGGGREGTLIFAAEAGAVLLSLPSTCV